MDDIFYTGPFCEHITKFISFKRSLGYSYHEEADRLKRFDQMTEKCYPKAAYITKDIADAWCERRDNESVSNQNGRIATIKQFTKYVAGIDNRTHVIQWKPAIVPKYKPYIFCHDEIKRFFASTDSMQFNGRQPLSHITYPVLFRVLYCCGMRISEVCALRIRDFEDGCFTVEHGKFGKGRLVPLHPMLSVSISEYIKRVHPFAEGEENLFIDGFEGKQLYSTKVYEVFRELLLKAGIKHGGKGKGPRVHDFRFTVIVHRLEQWIHENADINAWLPVLQFYVGHSDMDSLGYYLQITMEVHPNLREKIKEAFGDIIPLNYSKGESYEDD
ncbi:tyrosine-type recombinase/integrase [Lachnospiraceae bacterium OttesenSCG-928-D06]|nr:tyrosine-type recombinase/integrase [Lachnospiraceae bacterium OttesenSCG-928-D06]